MTSAAGNVASAVVGCSRLEQGVGAPAALESERSPAAASAQFQDNNSQAILPAKCVGIRLGAGSLVLLLAQSNWYGHVSSEVTLRVSPLAEREAPGTTGSACRALKPQI
eukprot:Opistho-1_new@28204